MKLQRIVMFALLIGALAGSRAYALPTAVVSWAENHSAAGGEFVVVTTENGTFRTFCLEFGTSLELGRTYYYETGNIVQLGGQNIQTGDPLSRGSAWLYSQFRAGTLSGYTGSNPQQTSLQNAFWMLENEIAFDGTNPWIVLAGGAIGGNLLDNANGAYGVFALNLWANANGTGDAQSLLGSVPDGGLTVTLLGLGLGGLALLRRKLS